MFDHSKWQSNVNRFLADELAKLPQVEGMALLQCWQNDSRFTKDGTEFTFKSCMVSNDALKTMAPRLLDGKLGWKDGDQKGLIIPASVAVKYFGTTQVAGRCMWNDKDSIVVRGVYEDFPDNSIIDNNT